VRLCMCQKRALLRCERQGYLNPKPIHVPLRTHMILGTYVHAKAHGTDT